MNKEVIQYLAKKILKEKRVELHSLHLFKNAKEYNTFLKSAVSKDELLTEEEFQIIKEWWENE